METEERKLKGLAVFAGLPEEAVRDFANMCVPRTFAKGEIIYLPGDEQGKSYLLLSGEVKLYRSSEGKKIVIQVLKSGDFFGDLSFAHGPSSLFMENFAKAVTRSEVCTLSIDDLSRLLSRQPSFTMVLLLAVRDRLHQAESKIRDLAVSSAQVRLINELIRHSIRHGKDTGGFLELEDRLTHQELAEMIGVTRETVTKTLQTLQADGFLEYMPGRLIRINKNMVMNKCVQCLRLETKNGGVVM